MTNINIGSNYTLTAEILFDNPLVPPSGVMIFKLGATTLGISEVINGVATLTISSDQLGVGTFNIEAFYAGDAHYTPAESAVPATIVIIGTTTTLLYLNPTIGGSGTSVVMNAVVFPAVSEGTITFYSTAHNPISGASNISVVDGVASVSVIASNIGGSTTVFAAYSGSATYLPSTSSGVHVSFG